ncbi:hypothetical protein MP638_003162 [Amoeboaphelidium occidentale]|nr:hypothetical protein MP638_003162 [Amoeboaphelidium occidentale]
MDEFISYRLFTNRRSYEERRMPKKDHHMSNSSASVDTQATDVSTASSTSLLVNGVKTLGSFYNAFRNRSLLQAVQVIADTFIGQDQTHDSHFGHKRAKTEVDLNVKYCADDLEEMKQCWESSEEQNIIEESEAQKEINECAEAVDLMSHIDEFVGKLEQKQQEKQLSLHKRSKTYGGLIGSFVGPAAALIIHKKSKKDLLAEKARNLKRELLEFIDEVNREKLEEKIEVPPPPKIFIPRAPTPPPMPIPRVETKELVVVTKQKADFVLQGGNNSGLGNIKDAISQKFDKKTGRPKLKTTKLRRSPGGTPMKERSPERGSLQFDLFNGLKKRFQLMRGDSDNNEDNDDDDFGQESPVKPASTKSKAPPPVPPKTHRVKILASKLK